MICRGDNKRWQPNYSGILGSFATGGISYLYYPASDRNATQLVLQNSLIRFGETAFENVLQEFVLRKLTPRLQNQHSVQPLKAPKLGTATRSAGAHESRQAAKNPVGIALRLLRAERREARRPLTLRDFPSCVGHETDLG